MEREQMGAGFLILMAAGVTILVGTVTPWAQLDQPSLIFSALQLHLYSPLVLATATGLALIGFALARTIWAGFVGILSAFAMLLVILMIHGDVYVGLRIAAPALALGEVVHVTGFGVAVFFAGGLMAGAGGVVTSIQTEPKVVTSSNGTSRR